MCDRRFPGNGQSGSDPEPEHLEMMNYNQLRHDGITERNSQLQCRNDCIHRHGVSSDGEMTNDNCPVELKDRIQCYGLSTEADGPGAGISKQGCVAEMRSLDQEKQVM